MNIILLCLIFTVFIFAVRLIGIRPNCTQMRVIIYTYSTLTRVISYIYTDRPDYITLLACARG